MFTPDICIYHGGCSDGFTAAWAIWEKYGNDIEYIACKYGDAAPNVVGKNVVMVDFSFKQPVLRAMAAEAKRILILDHHKTAEADLVPLIDEGVINGSFDMDRSGAGMAWDWAHEGYPRPILINHVEDRDLWRWAIPNSREFCAYLDTYAFDFNTWARLSVQAESAEYVEMLSGGRAVERKLQRDVDSLAKHPTWVRIAGHKVPVVNANHMFASDLGNRLAQLPDAPFGATYFIDDRGFNCFSLRSSNDKVDVSEIASKFGGGGHRNASGFSVPVGTDIS